MRRTALLAAAVLALAAAPAATLAGAEQQRPTTVNHRVSNRQVALNQPVRLEFTTMPRQVENVDVAQAVANAVTIAGAQTWRLLGRPAVLEHDKTRTITVGLTLLPRMPGRLVLPQVPLTWMQGDQIADFGDVKVDEKILVGGELAEQPKEAQGVAGYPWGAKLADLRTVRIADNLIETQGDRAVAHAQPGLDLVFRGGELAEAMVVAQGLTLDQARESFFARWGLPQAEAADAVTWIIGWTRITATAAGKDGPAVLLHLAREDIQVRLDQQRVRSGVFDVLDGANAPKPTPEAEAALKERQRREAEEFLRQQRPATQQAQPPAPAPAAPSPAQPAAPAAK